MISTKMPCDIYPKHIQYRQRMTLRISAFASKRFPQDQILAAHLDDEVLPTWTTFLHHNTAQIEQWLKHWKLRSILLQYWQSFWHELWEHHAVRNISILNAKTSTSTFSRVYYFSCRSCPNVFDIALSSTVAYWVHVVSCLGSPEVVSGRCAVGKCV